MQIVAIGWLVIVVVVLVYLAMRYSNRYMWTGVGLGVALMAFGASIGLAARMVFG